MTIDFSCPRCGTSFQVGDNLAGRKARCKKCDHRLTIPAAAQATPAATRAATTGMFRLPDAAAVTAGSVATQKGGKQTGRSGKDSFYGFTPISEDYREPEIRRQREREIEAEDEGPPDYQIARDSLQVPAAVARAKRKSQPPSALSYFYSEKMRGVYRRLSRAGDYAYLISIPFFVLLLVAVVLKQYNLAMLGATGVVLANIGRLAINIFYLALVPFRKSPLQGILFLIPPITFYFLFKHWDQMKRVAAKIPPPALAIGAVILIFTFVPWLSGSGVPADAPITDRIKGEAGALVEELQEGVRQGVKAIDEKTAREE
jgi:predicted Zn finger-like uncharacterized protein